MRKYCVRCGQPIDAATSTGGNATCPACGQTTYAAAQGDEENSPENARSGAARLSEPAGRFPRGRDLLIMTGAVALLLLLLFLFLRPSQRGVRQWVFGDLGSTTPPANRVDGGRTGTHGVSGEGSASPGSGNPGSPGREGAAGGVSGLGTGGRAQSGVRGDGSPPDGAVPDSIHKQTGSVGDDTQTPPVGGTGGQTATGGGIGRGDAGKSSGNSSAGSGASGAVGGASGGPGTGGPGSGGVGTGGSGSGPTGAASSGGGGTGGAGNGSAGTQAGSGNGSSPAGPGSQAQGGGANGAGLTPGAAGQSGTGSTPGAAPGSAGQPSGAGLSGNSTAGPNSSAPASQSGRAASALGAGNGSILTATNGLGATPPDAVQEGVAKEKTDDLLQMARNDAQATPTDGKNTGPFDPDLGTNIVFVLDRSSSMKQDGKSAAARRALVNTLGQLGADKSFYVLFFPLKEMPAPGPLPATRENVRFIADWIDTVSHADRTDPAKTVLRGLDFTPDTVWLLSDGQFPAQVAKTIREANAGPQARINTIAFYNGDGEPLMRQIAAENHGTYHFEPRPVKDSGVSSPTISPAPAADAPPPRSP